jgi:glycosyltransferase involved in cell wall biosynthesis
VEKLFAEEREHRPDYLSILPGLNDSAEKRAKKDAEIGMADLLLLSSTFSVKSLALFPGKLPNYAVIPYGAPSEVAPAPTPAGNKLRVIFVGGLSQIKGMSYFVEAISKVRELVEVTVIGKRVGECQKLDQFLASVNWIESVPHAKVLQIMKQCDVLILPSISDGFGLVVLEAMSQGLTAIVSDHAGVSDVIAHGTNGFVAPVRGVDVMVDQLEQLAKQPDLLQQMKVEALVTARSYTWARYRASLLSALQSQGLTL